MLSRHALMLMAFLILDQDVSAVSHDNQTLLRYFFIPVCSVETQLSARLKLAATALLDALDSRDLLPRETPSSHAA